MFCRLHYRRATNNFSLISYTSMRQYDAPLRAMQMLEIVLKSPFLDKAGVQVS